MSYLWAQSNHFLVLILNLLLLLLLLFILLQIGIGILMQKSSHSVLQIDENFRDDKPCETTKPSFFFVTERAVYIQDHPSHRSKCFIIKERFILVEFYDIAGQVKQNGSFSGHIMEIVRIFNVIILCSFIVCFVIGKMSGGKEKIEISCSQVQNCRNESVFAKHLDFLLCNCEISRINLIFSVNTNQRNQSWKLSFIVNQNLKNLFDLIRIQFKILFHILLDLKFWGQFMNNFFINFSTLLCLTFTQQVLYFVLDIMKQMTQNWLTHVFRLIFFLHEIRIARYQKSRVNLRTKSRLREINSFSMYFSQLNTIFILGKIDTLISFNQMTVINLSQLLVIEILNEKMHHFFVLFINIFIRFIFLHFFFLVGSIDQIELFHFLRNKLPIPTDEEVITVKVRSTNLCSYRVFSFLWKDNTVYILWVVVWFASVLKSSPCLQLGYASHFSDISWMETGISGDDDIPLNIFLSRFELKVVEYGAVQLSFS